MPPTIVLRMILSPLSGLERTASGRFTRLPPLFQARVILSSQRLVPPLLAISALLASAPLCLAAGHHNRAIARQLGLSPGTVRKHLENTFARLGVASRTEAIAKIRPDSAWH
jgi:hypothetical protein